MKIHGRIEGGWAIECTEEELYLLAGMDYPPEEGPPKLGGDEIRVVPVHKKLAAIEAHIAKVVIARDALAAMVEELESALEPVS